MSAADGACPQGWPTFRTEKTCISIAGRGTLCPEQVLIGVLSFCQLRNSD
jgi:hypothetical protein